MRGAFVIATLLGVLLAQGCLGLPRAAPQADGGAPLLVTPTNATVVPPSDNVTGTPASGPLRCGIAPDPYSQRLLASRNDSSGGEFGPLDYFVVKYVNETLHAGRFETRAGGPPPNLSVGDEACVHLEIVPQQPRANETVRAWFALPTGLEAVETPPAWNGTLSDSIVTLVVHVRAAQPGHWNATGYTQRDDAPPFPNAVALDVS